MLNRVIRGGFLLLLLGLTAASAAELTIIRTYTGWRDGASFKRISEYFTGKENTGGEAVLRTHPEERAGYYFLIRVNNPGTPRMLRAHLQVITNAASAPQDFHFSPHVDSGDTVFHLGLTGADWPEASVNPVAWKLDLSDADGKVLATVKSYLWEKPAN